MFDIFTGPSPVTVVEGTTSDPLPFPELASDGATPTVFLRLVTHGPTGTPPTFTLHTDLGPATTLTADFQTVTATDGTQIADAATATAPDGTHHIRIITQQLGTTWSLTITNNDPTTRTYIGVAADDPDDTRQPWIDAATDLAFDTIAGRPQIQAARVANRGTGPLRITAPTGAQNAFVLGSVPTRVEPNSVAALTMTFTPASTGDGSTTFTIASNDLSPGGPGHNQTIHIVTRTRQFTPGTILVREDGPDGSSVVAIEPGTSTRRLVLGAQQLTGLSLLMVEADGQLLFVSDDGAAPLVRIHPVTGAETPLRFRPAVENIRSVTLAPDGSVVVVATRFGGPIVRLDLATRRSDVLFAGDGGFVGTHALAISGSGAIYCAAGGLYRIDAATSQRHVIVEHLPDTRACTVDAQGRVLLSCLFQDAGGGFTFSEGSVRRVDVATGEVEFIVSGGRISPQGIALDASGGILFADNGADPGVHRINPDGIRELVSPGPSSQTYLAVTS